MSAIRARALLLVLFSLLFVGRPRSREQATEIDRDDAMARPDIHAARNALAKMPIRFEANLGQHDRAIRFVARRGKAAIALRDDGATLVIQQHGTNERGQMDGPTSRIVVGLTPEGARPVAPKAEGQLTTKANYFIGSDPSKWHTNVPAYSKVTYPSVLDGVDLVYHGENGALEYDFVVAPGAEVDRIAMNVQGAGKLSISAAGALRIHTETGDIVQPPPVVYQRDATGRRREIASSYRLVDTAKIGFEVASYDRTKPLVIDPVLGYATYLGGIGHDVVTAIAADAAGSTYVAGRTSSTDFPSANAYDSTYNGSASDVFVAKLDSTGSQLLYATYLGGTGNDNATGIAIGADDTAYVTGDTNSSDFPTVSPLPSSGRRDLADGFVARLGPDGSSLAYATYLSGRGEDQPKAIAVDGSGIYLAGTTTSRDIGEPPPSPSGGSDRDGFVAKLAPAGNAIAYVKYLGGTADDHVTGLAIDGAGNTYITGYTYSGNFPQTPAPLKPSCQGQEMADAFVAKLDASGSTFDYATCLGGASDDFAHAITVDASGSAYIAGATSSPDFPAPSSIQPFGGSADAFISKIDPQGTALVYSTFVGGTNEDRAYGVAVDASGTAWITGTTNSADYPLVAPIQAVLAGGGEGGHDALVTRVNAAGSVLLFSSFYGGATEADEGAAVAVSGSSLHLGGNTSSTELPVFHARQETNSGEQDGFVATISVPPLLISPPHILVPTSGSAQFTVTGGAGFGYVFSLQANASGGTISPSGTYSAGALGNTVDVVVVTDAAGVTATATVRVGSNTSSLLIDPATTSVPPKGVRTFAARGGVPPFTFSLASNASGGTMTPAGAYTAGTKGSVVDIVRVTDSAGSSMQATVAVGPAITIAPAKPATPPNGSVSFSATGGSGAGYAWSLVTNGSGGAIAAGTGQYKAGGASSTVDTVEVTDSLGNRARVNVSVGSGVAITPSNPTTTTKGSIGFTAVGGSGVYTWSLSTAPSGGAIDASSGLYTAGTTGHTIDVVHVRDSVGNTSDVEVTVGPSLTLDPPAATVVTGAELAFAAAGGSGTGYTFAVTANQSGGTVTPSGLYTAGSAPGIDIVRLTDSLGNADEATVTVAATPNTGTLPSQGTSPNDAGAIRGLNIAGGGVNEACSCRAVGGPTGAGSADGAARGLGVLMLVLSLVLRRRHRE